MQRMLGNRRFWSPPDQFEVIAHDHGRFVVRNTTSDDPCPVFDSLEEARAYVARQYAPL